MSKAGKRETKKKALKKKPASASAGPRRVKLAPYRPISLKKRVKPSRPQLPGAFRLFGRAIMVLVRNWRLFLAIVIVYMVLNILLVRGLAATSNLSGIKSALSSSFKGPSGKVGLGLTLYLALLSGSNSSTPSPSAGVYQGLLVVIVSLAIVWSLREVYNQQRIGLREPFYKGMYPFIPVLLVLAVVGLQLIPLIIGASIYSIVISGGIAVGVWEKLIWGAVFVILAFLSLYMICSSIFALYIVTLPDMTPMKALRSARTLVRYRRFTVLRKLLFLPVALLVLAAAIIVPLSLIITPAAEWIFFVLSLASLPLIHSYLYGLYRELLHE